jgi:hypothetical protein
VLCYLSVNIMNYEYFTVYMIGIFFFVIIMVGYIRLLISRAFVSCLGVCLLDVYCSARWYNMDCLVVICGVLELV